MLGSYERVTIFVYQIVTCEKKYKKMRMIYIADLQKAPGIPPGASTTKISFQKSNHIIFSFNRM